MRVFFVKFCIVSFSISFHVFACDNQDAKQSYVGKTIITNENISDKIKNEISSDYFNAIDYSADLGKKYNLLHTTMDSDGVIRDILSHPVESADYPSLLRNLNKSKINLVIHIQRDSNCDPSNILEAFRKLKSSSKNIKTTIFFDFKKTRERHPIGLLGRVGGVRVPRGSVLRTRAVSGGRRARVRSTEPRGTQRCPFSSPSQNPS